MSGPAPVSHRNGALIDDYRDLSLSTGVLKHGFQLVLTGKDIYIVDSNASGLVGFTSLDGVWSGVLSKNGHFRCHAAPPALVVIPARMLSRCAEKSS